MCMSPKAGEEITNFSLKNSSKAKSNYSKKNLTKLKTNKSTFSRNETQQTHKQSSRRIIQNPISTNSTSNNSSYKNFSNAYKQNNNVFHHQKKSETSFNFMSFFNQNQNSNPNIFYQNQNQPYLNYSFFNELSEKESKSKEIFIKKIENKKIINKGMKNKNKLNPDIKIFNNYNITTTRINKIKSKNKDKKIIINLAHSPNTNRVYNNKSFYHSKYLSPTTSRNIVLPSQIQELHSNINSFGKLKKIKNPKKHTKNNNSNSIIKKYYYKNVKEKYETDTFNKNISNTNTNTNKGSGNMFAIHKIIENTLIISY